MIAPIELRPTSKANLVKTIRIPAGGRKQLVFRLTNEDGQPIDLTKEPENCPAPVPQFNAEPRAGENNSEIRLRAVSQFGDVHPHLDVLGSLVKEDGTAQCLTDAGGGECNGLVQFLLDHTQTCIPGVFRCEIQRVVKPDFLIETWPAYFAIEPSLFGPGYRSGVCGPITIPEVRLALNDLQMGEVDLLDHLEFNDTQILYAMRQPVDMWNETPPSGVYFSTENFPYRYNWLQATVSILLRMAAHSYRRNQLNYSAGGIDIDDQNKFNQYQQEADKLLAEYNQWMRRTKLQLNIRRTWRAGV